MKHRRQVSFVLIITLIVSLCSGYISAFAAGTGRIGSCQHQDVYKRQGRIGAGEGGAGGGGSSAGPSGVAGSGPIETGTEGSCFVIADRLITLSLIHIS